MGSSRSRRKNRDGSRHPLYPNFANALERRDKSASLPPTHHSTHGHAHLDVASTACPAPAGRLALVPSARRICKTTINNLQRETKKLNDRNNLRNFSYNKLPNKTIAK